MKIINVIQQVYLTALRALQNIMLLQRIVLSKILSANLLIFIYVKVEIFF